jgi:hypothetical protein
MVKLEHGARTGARQNSGSRAGGGLRVAFTILVFSSTQASAADPVSHLPDAEPHSALSSSSSSSSSSAAGAAVKPGKVLTGGAKASQSLHSTVRLFPQSHAPRPVQPPVQYSFRRLFYIPNAPVTPFHRVQYVAPKTRELSVLPASAPATKVEPPKSTEPTGPPQWSYTMTPPNGIMSWAPGYDSARVPRRQPEVCAANPANNFLTTGTGDHPFSNRPVILQLRATPELFSKAPGEKRSLNWDEWYKHICKTVYDQWLTYDTCAGKASVHVTVWSSRDIECKIIDFSQAPDVQRDTARESAFRDSVLRAVNSLDRCAVLDFPLRATQNKIAFDLDMTRSVTGSAGYQVVVARGSNSSPGETP